jgi:hypothetical protein
MPLLDWLRSRRETPDRKTPRPATTTAASSARSPNAAQPVERLHLAADGLVASWRPKVGLLDLRAPSPVARGARVMVLVTGAGVPVALHATVRTATPGRADHALELAVDPDGQALLTRLAAGLRGEGPLPRQRAERYRVSFPAVVTGQGGAAFMTATSLSEGGCALAWSGPPPRLGAGLLLRLGSGPRAVTVRAMTCWVRQAPSGLRAGLRFLHDPSVRAALQALVEDAKRSSSAA